MKPETKKILKSHIEIIKKKKKEVEDQALQVDRDMGRGESKKKELQDKINLYNLQINNIAEDVNA